MDNITEKYGYWGKPTAAVDWCENNYEWSFYVAEFFNALSSIPIALSGIYGVHMCLKYKYEFRFTYTYALIICIGIGSAAFHGTLLYTGQILDELPMIYCMLGYFYACMQTKSKNAEPRWLFPALVAYGICFTITYLFIPFFFTFFLALFILGNGMVMLKAIQIHRDPATQWKSKRLMEIAYMVYYGGFFLFWVPEVIYCERFGMQQMKFHALFHLCSAVGPYLLLLFFCFEREVFRGHDPKLRFEGALLPVVHTRVDTKTN